MKATIRKSLLLTSLLAACVFASGCSSAQAQSSDSQMDGSYTRTVTVNGTGMTRVEPDEAVAVFEFTEKARELQDAHRAVQERVQQFVDTVVEAGWDRDLIRQSGINYHPNYDYIQNEGQVFRDFSASVTLTFRTENLDDVPGILDLAIERGVTQIQPVRYSVTNRQAQEGEARVKAIQNARQKAQEYASAAGASLADVVSITESHSGGPQPRPAMRAMEADDASGSFANVSPNQVELTSNVTVTWKLQ
jgi:uncharacterized protein YggE